MNIINWYVQLMLMEPISSKTFVFGGFQYFHVWCVVCGDPYVSCIMYAQTV